VLRNMLCLMATCAALVPAAAGAVVVLDEHFDSDLPTFAQAAGWEWGFCDDQWRTDLNGGVVPALDFPCADCSCEYGVYTSPMSQCVDSDPFDNHIKTGNRQWQNYTYSVKFRNTDNDTFGVVFRYWNSANFYLFYLTQEGWPDFSTGCSGASAAGARLVRVRTGANEQLKSDPFMIYDANVVHTIRVTAVTNHIRIEFDRNGDGFFDAGDVFYDDYDSMNLAHLSGKVGLYAYNNGVLDEDWVTAAPCANGTCYFDDMLVDLAPPNNQDCGNLPPEGKCTGNTLTFCSVAGYKQQVPCANGECCRYFASESMYTCMAGLQCQSCANACADGQKGCNANLTHKFYCGQGDDSACLEPVYEACPPNVLCDPATGTCTTPCVPDCKGKACGDDTCGGSCGSCNAGFVCTAGACVKESLGQFGEPCATNDDCTSGLCIESPSGSVCTTSCSAFSTCPEGWECKEVAGGNGSTWVCAPTGGCTPKCDGLDCGPDGCGGSCGYCTGNLECAAGQCKLKAGDPCAAAENCASGLCIYFQIGARCSGPCSTDSGCPEDWTCIPWPSPEMPNICAPQSAVTPYDECKELADCINSCPEGDPGCYATCYFMANKSAQKGYADLLNCAAVSCAQCAQDSDCISTCILDQCFPAFGACFPGTELCVDTLACMDNCPPAETACTDGCYDQALPGAKKQLVELFDCIAPLCGPAPEGGCLAAAVAGPCKAAYDSCIGQCQPVCAGAVCGDDGCGGSCGSCLSSQVCDQGQCVQSCTPDCDKKDCGDDGCGGVCGTCAQDLVCTLDGQCETPAACTPSAAMKCVDNDLYWFDSCGLRGALAQECPLGCQFDACVQPKPEVESDVVAPQDDASTGTQNLGEAADFTAKGGKSGGCSAGALPSPSCSPLFLLALLLSILLPFPVARRLSARPEPVAAPGEQAQRTRRSA